MECSAMMPRADSVLNSSKMEIDILDFTVMGSSKEKASIYGTIAPFTLATSTQDSEKAWENGNLVHRTTNFTSETSCETRSKAQGNTSGTTAAFTKATSSMTSSTFSSIQTRTRQHSLSRWSVHVRSMDAGNSDRSNQQSD